MIDRQIHRSEIGSRTITKEIKGNTTKHIHTHTCAAKGILNTKKVFQSSVVCTEL